MYLEGILSISGKPGLYKMVSQARNALVVEVLDTGKRFPAHASAKISALEDVAIYTEKGEMPLAEVFNLIYEDAEAEEILSHKSSAEDLKAFFAQVLPDYDRDRVYVSDIKKMVQWFNILLEHNILNAEAIEEYKKSQEEESDEDSKSDKEDA